jgi:ribosomal peptide maturation radical SAM protein 1
MIDSGLAVRPNLLLPLETSRGCWWGEKHHCTFCGLNAEGMKHRRKSPGRFRHEAQAISERYAVSYFFMADNILQANLGNGLLAWNREPNQQLSFFFEIRPTASRKQVAELVEHGVTMVQPGIEHFSTKTLLLMEKNLRGISNIAFLKYAREYGLRPIYNLLCRFPGEDESEYLRLALDLPKLTHLRPPSGVSPIQFHRFSPYHSSAERFGLKLRPYAGYEMLYPFKEGTLARIAYIFVRADSDDDPADLPSYVAETSRLISDWREYYVEGICTLTWIHAAGGVHIEDRRRAFTPADYHLEDAACHLFYALDEPRSLPAIVRQFQTGELPQRPCPSDGSTIYEEPLSTVAPQRQETIGFSAADFVRDPRGHLQPMLDAGLLIEEDDRLLALPVHKRRRRLDPQWNWFDV